MTPRASTIPAEAVALLCESATKAVNAARCSHVLASMNSDLLVTMPVWGNRLKFEQRPASVLLKFSRLLGAVRVLVFNRMYSGAVPGSFISRCALLAPCLRPPLDHLPVAGFSHLWPHKDAGDAKWHHCWLARGPSSVLRHSSPSPLLAPLACFRQLGGCCAHKWMACCAHTPEGTRTCLMDCVPSQR